MTGSADDGRFPPDPAPDGAAYPPPAATCTRCGRALADEVCLHCAAEVGLGDAPPVRTFVGFPGPYSGDGPPPPWRPPEPDDQRAPAGYDQHASAGYPDRSGATPTAAPAARARSLLDPPGWGPRGMAAKVVIAGGSILLAAAVGIVGAVVAGPAPTPPSARTPSAAHGAASGSRPASRSRPPTGPSTPAVTGTVVLGTLCLDDYAGGTDNGNPVQMWRCDDSEAQRWTFAVDGTMRVRGKCLRPAGGRTAYGTKVELWDCDNTAAQRWRREADGSLVHPASGACLEDPALGDRYGSRPQLAACDNGPGQRWGGPSV